MNVAKARDTVKHLERDVEREGDRLKAAQETLERVDREIGAANPEDEAQLVKLVGECAAARGRVEAFEVRVGRAQKALDSARPQLALLEAADGLAAALELRRRLAAASSSSSSATRGCRRDRRVLYALASIGCLRHGEAAGLRWRNVVSGLEPLGRIVVLTSYDQGDTKTGAERWMPMHPVLAAMLAEWKLAGWAREQGRAPAPDDLVVPHSRPTNRGPRVEFGRMRSDHDSYKRMRKDLAALGRRIRRFHDLRRTGITLFREDGAERDVLRLCTHGAPGQDVMELYTSFGWAKLCAQVQPLKLSRAKARGIHGVVQTFVRRPQPPGSIAGSIRSMLPSEKPRRRAALHSKAAWAAFRASCGCGASLRRAGPLHRSLQPHRVVL